MKRKDYFWYKNRHGQTVFMIRDEKTGHEERSIYLVEYDASMPARSRAIPVKLDPNLQLMERRASIAIDRIGASITDESLYSALENIVTEAEAKEHPAA